MIKNRKALYNYSLIESEIAGIVLMGSEIKPITNSLVDISESFIYIDGNDVWIKNMFIKNIINNAYSHEELRDRKLLMTKKQIKKWTKLMEKERLTILPLKMFFDDKHRVKLEIFLGKGKKLHDKRHSEKEKEMKKEMKNY